MFDYVVVDIQRLDNISLSGMINNWEKIITAQLIHGDSTWRALLNDSSLMIFCGRDLEKLYTYRKPT